LDTAVVDGILSGYDVEEEIKCETPVGADGDLWLCWIGNGCADATHFYSLTSTLRSNPVRKPHQN